MEDLIRRQDAIKKLCKCCQICNEGLCEEGDCIDLKLIRLVPSVEAIPVEWIRKYTEENRLYQSDDFDIYINDMIADWVERKEE